jgi:hypothetical protein
MSEWHQDGKFVDDWTAYEYMLTHI